MFESPVLSVFMSNVNDAENDNYDGDGDGDGDGDDGDEDDVLFVGEQECVHEEYWHPDNSRSTYRFHFRHYFVKNEQI